MPEKKKPTAPEPRGVSVRISDTVRRQAKVYAAQHNMSLLAVVDAAVMEYLKKHGA